MKLTPARRVATVPEIEHAGDYCRRTVLTNDEEADCVFFLLPIARDETVTDPGARSLHHVRQPPHVFRECPDGSLEIRASIGSYGSNPAAGYIWHGYLDEGNVWREL